ncbi:MAG: ribosomal protein S18-alanine N-acetyltransferase [Candidatus Binataceae bacterium]
MGLEIRDATPGDLARICEIESLCFSQAWSLGAFQRELSLPFSRLAVATIAEDGDLAAGFLCRWLVADESHILNIAVHPAMRRMGIGTELMRLAIAEAKAKHVHLLTLEVRRSNLAARSLYRKFGMEERRLRKNYYAAGEDAIVMELRFA